MQGFKLDNEKKKKTPIASDEDDPTRPKAPSDANAVYYRAYGILHPYQDEIL